MKKKIIFLFECAFFFSFFCSCVYSFRMIEETQFQSKYESFTCNDIPKDDILVCSGNGECIKKDVCNCTYPYVGNFCQINEIDLLHTHNKRISWIVVLIVNILTFSCLLCLCACIICCCYKGIKKKKKRISVADHENSIKKGKERKLEIEISDDKFVPVDIIQNYVDEVADWLVEEYKRQPSPVVWNKIFNYQKKPLNPEPQSLSTTNISRNNSEVDLTDVEEKQILYNKVTENFRKMGMQINNRFSEVVVFLVENSKFQLEELNQRMLNERVCQNNNELKNKFFWEVCKLLNQEYENCLECEMKNYESNTKEFRKFWEILKINDREFQKAQKRFDSGEESCSLFGSFDGMNLSPLVQRSGIKTDFSCSAAEFLAMSKSV